MKLTLVMVLAFLVAIGILIAVHEFGHFWVARRLGFKVLRFSIGFGKPVWLRRAADGVEYALGAIPLGGYVKLADEREGPVAPADLERAFNRRPVWQRILVLMAGVGANFLFALLAYWILFMHGVPGVRPVLGSVRADSLASHAGLVAGDELIDVGGRPVATREAAVLELLSRIVDDGRIVLHVRRGSSDRELTLIVPEERRRALTEPGAWSAGLGLAFSEPHLAVVLGTVVAGGAAAAAGLRPGDEILAVDGRPVTEYLEFRSTVRGHPGATLLLEVRRGASHLAIPVLARATRDPNDNNALIGQIGVESAGRATFPPEMLTLARYGPLAAVGPAASATWSKTALTAKFLWSMVTGHVSLKNVSGPISIAAYAGVSALEGPAAFLDFLAIISISLGVLNLLPIPILDGGQIAYQLAEWVSGRPLPERVQVLGQQLGIVLLILLMSLAFYNDVAWRFG
ncbi:MAG TPA: RIP metalloprotease RseP [Steroidobacteraceae bacterium]|nr:RIP metalloprotease RseP [Steroidobacteraceae bacterium]